MAPETCPNCGVDVPSKAKACPGCGACEATGWSEEAGTGGLGLPDDSFDYGEYVQKEFGERKIVPRAAIVNLSQDTVRSTYDSPGFGRSPRENLSSRETIPAKVRIAIPRGIRWYWYVVAIALVAALLRFLFRF